MIKIRLSRFGRKRQATYRIVAINSRSRRQGKCIVQIGIYDPIRNHVSVDSVRIHQLLAQGASTSPTVHHILVKLGFASDRRLL